MPGTKRFYRGPWLLISIPLTLLFIGYSWYQIRLALRAPAPRATAAMLVRADRVNIYRDTYGVAHIHGRSDADAAFGLAYAHAEDDFPLIQGVLAASTGKLAKLILNLQAIGNDFYVRLIRSKDQLKEHYDKLSIKTRALLEAYAEGINYYAALHPEEAFGPLYPLSGQSIAVGFIHKVPLMFNLTKVLSELNKSKKLEVGDELKLAWTAPQRDGENVSADSYHDNSFWKLFTDSEYRMTASNVHALHRSRSTDNVSRLNINSHQPWDGPVSWYETHVISDEGWNMLGGTFPGAPLVLVGHNRKLGWGHTVNKPDLIDIYKLKMHPEKKLLYRLDGKWLPLEVREERIAVDLKLFTYYHKMKTYWSKHGPVFKTDRGYYAIRYAGMGRAIYAVEQWYYMNKAESLEEWRTAMHLAAIPMFNTGYADRDNIFYIYNASLPLRKPGFDYSKILPGDRSELIWTEYLTHDRLPMVKNPPAGFIMNTNTAPWYTTTGSGNPDKNRYAKEYGIEDKLNNRGMRSRKLLSPPEKLNHKDFMGMKFDQNYEEGAPIFTDVIDPLIKNFQAQNESQHKAMDVLRRFKKDRNTAMDKTDYALAALTYHPMVRKYRAEFNFMKKEEAFLQAIDILERYYGTLTPEWGRVQRLHRGKLDLPLGGGWDVLNAVEPELKEGRLIGTQGDSYFLIVEFLPDGKTRSHSRHQYGNVNRSYSPHYDDQALDFTKRTVKQTWLELDDLKANEKLLSYHPGQERSDLSKKYK